MSIFNKLFFVVFIKYENKKLSTFSFKLCFIIELNIEIKLPFLQTGV